MRRPARAHRDAANGPRPGDWALAVLVAVAHLAPVRAGQAETLVDPAWAGALSAVLALGAGLPLAWRRSHPRLVAAAVLGCYAGLAVIEGLVPAWSAWVLIWSLATTVPDRRRSIALSGAAAAATGALLVGAQLLHERSGGLGLLLATTAVVALVAVLLRSERGRVEEAGRRATIEERLRIARDLHDLVGHGLSTVAVQSSTARMAIAAGDADTAQRALAAVESSSRTAMREMRQMLDVLSETDTSGSPPAQGSSRTTPAQPASQTPSPGLVDIETLVANLRAGGVAVTLEEGGDWGSARRDVQLCAYRVVQEGLTNAVKHAPESPVTVRLASTGESGEVSVETVGAPGPQQEGGRGRGLEGLRTRVTALSGEFWSGPTPQGWRVEARLPLHEAPQRGGAP